MEDALKPLRQQTDSNLVLMRQLHLLRFTGISRNEEQRCMLCSDPQCSLARMDLERLPTIVLYLPASEYTHNPTFVSDRVRRRANDSSFLPGVPTLAPWLG